jgi:imidazolonepropionase-like amidohydrolase
MLLPGSARAADGGQVMALRAGRIVTVAGDTIENGVILVRGGKIEDVGKDLQVPGDAQVIDASKQTVVPGFIDAHSHLGLSLDALSEIDETVQPIAAEMQVVDAFDPAADALAKAVRCGVTAVMLAPGSRNPVGGQTAIVKLSGGGPDRWLVRQAAGVKLSVAGDALMHDRKPTSMPGLIAMLRERLDSAKSYTAGAKFDPSAEALNRLVQRAVPAYIQAHTVEEVSTAIDLITRYELQAAITGGDQADELAEILVQQKVPIIYGPLLLYSKDKDLKRPARLTGAGVKLAFSSCAPRTCAGDIRTSAILAVRYGLSRDEAMKALTLNAAEILGVADRLGSIQKGRDADLVIFDADPLEASSRVETVIIDGKVVYQRERT